MRMTVTYAYAHLHQNIVMQMQEYNFTICLRTIACSDSCKILCKNISL